MESHVWFGGYSRRFIEKFLWGDDRNQDRTDSEIDAMIRWVDIDHTTDTWVTNLISVRIADSALFFDGRITFDTASVYTIIPEKYFNSMLTIMS